MIRPSARSGLLLWCAVAWVCGASPLAARLTWTVTRMELTARPGDTTLTAVYPFENRTGDTIHILDLHASCGCTVPELEKHTYAPGEKGEVKLTFTIGSRQGLQTKTVSIRTSQGDTVLQFIAHLPQRLQIAPRLVVFRPGDDAPRPVKLSFHADVPVSGVTVSDPGPAFIVRLSETRPGADYTLTVAPSSEASSGDDEARATLSIRSNGASGAVYTDTVFLRRLSR